VPAEFEFGQAPELEAGQAAPQDEAPDIEAGQPVQDDGQAPPLLPEADFGQPAPVAGSVLLSLLL
jgi:hypothetical protein